MQQTPLSIKPKACAATTVNISPTALAAAVKSLHRIDCEDRLEYATTFGRDHELTLDALRAGGGRLIGFSSIRLIEPGGRLVGFEILPIAEGEEGEDETDPNLLHGLRMDFRDLKGIAERNRAGEIVELFSSGNFRRDMLVRSTVFKSLFRALSYPDDRLLAIGDAELGLGGPNGKKTKITAGMRHRIAAAIYSEIRRNVFCKRHATALALFAAMPPSRVPVFSDLLVGDDLQDGIELLRQLPILICFPARLSKFFAREGWRQRDILADLNLEKGFRKLGLQAAGGLLYLNGVQARPRADMEVGDFAYITAEALRHCPEAGFRQKTGLFIAALANRLINDDARAAEILKWAWVQTEKAIKQRKDLTLEEAAAIANYIGAPEPDLQAASIDAFTTATSLATACANAGSWREFCAIRAKEGGSSAAPYPKPDWAPINCQLPNSSLMIARIPNEQILFGEASRNKNCAHDHYAQEAASGFAALYALRRLPTNRDQQQRRFPCPILGIEVVNVGMMRLYRSGAGAYCAEARGPSNETLAPTYRAAIDAFLAPPGE